MMPCGIEHREDLGNSAANRSTSLRSPLGQLFVSRVQLIESAAIVIDSSCKQQQQQIADPESQANQFDSPNQ
jgi:hypothetical protein